MSLIIDVPVRVAEIPVKIPPLGPAQVAIRQVSALLAADHALLALQAPRFPLGQFTRANPLHDTPVLLRLHAVHAPGRRPMTPLVPEARMPVMGTEAAVGSASPGAAVTAVAPVGVSAAAEREALIGAAMPEAALAVVALVADVARRSVEITIQVPALAAAQISV
jgi:hypothetical protein